MSDRYIYAIDGADIITDVNAAWIKFAADNEAPELTSAAVVGQPIWRFITGPEVRSLYREMFNRLRAAPAEVVIPFRCDSSTVIRRMTLTMRTRMAGAIEFEGALVHRETRPPVDVLLRWLRRSDLSIPICSVCRLLLVRGEWIEASAAVTRERLFSAYSCPRLEETICPGCRAALD